MGSFPRMSAAVVVVDGHHARALPVVLVFVVANMLNVTLNRRQMTTCRRANVQKKIKRVLLFLDVVAKTVQREAHTFGMLAASVSTMRAHWRSVMCPPDHLTAHRGGSKRGCGAVFRVGDPVVCFDEFSALCPGRVVGVHGDAYEVAYTCWGLDFTEIKTKSELAYPGGDERILLGQRTPTGHLQYFWVRRTVAGRPRYIRVRLNTGRIAAIHGLDDGFDIFARVAHGTLTGDATMPGIYDTGDAGDTGDTGDATMPGVYDPEPDVRAWVWVPPPAATRATLS